MRFITSTFLAVAALTSFVMGAENPIIYPDASSKIVAGTTFTITWTPTTTGSVSFKLRQGPSDNLDDVEWIVKDTENDGTYEWTPKKTLPAGSDYAIMIVDAAGNVNYTPLIKIESDVPKVSSTAKVSSSTKASSIGSSTITSAPAQTTFAYTNTTMITSVTAHGNSTATASGNLTRTSSTRSSSPTSTGAEETATAISTGAAAGLLKSPLALVVCVLGAVLYLN